MAVDTTTVAQDFDIEEAINEFAKNSAATTLELPHMTTGQRKLTKKLVEAREDLVCESYGFGQDRNLHLFKKGARPAKNTGGVKVKNTFIDDWEDGLTNPESIVFRSMPVALSDHVLQESKHDHIVADVHGMELPTLKEDAKVEEWEISSADRSTAPSTSGSLIGTPTGSMKSVMIKKPPGLPTPTGVEIRNTFIHFDCPADDRVVQSMPHGMFSQYLQAEIGRFQASESERCPPPAVRPPCPPPAHPPTLPPTAPPAHAPILPPVIPSAPAEPVTCPEGGDLPLAPGTAVVTCGLLKLPAFNGLNGTVQSYCPETGRYDVLLLVPTGGQKWVKVKRDNLQLSGPTAPPEFYPSLAR